MFNTGESVGHDDAAPSAADGELAGHAVSVENSGASGRLVIVCDHASNYVPAEYRGLGLGAEDLLRHIAWDPGALGVSRALARRLCAPLVAGGVSRLVIDCNREPEVVELDRRGE